DRAAHAVAAFFLAAPGHATAHLVMALLPAGLIDRPAAVHRAIPVGCAIHGPLALDRFLPHDRAIARPVAGAALVAVAGLANRPHDRFLHGLAAGVPALLHDGVVDQLVANPAPLLRRPEAALGIAARRTVGVPDRAAMLGGRLAGPKAGQHHHPRRSHAHPHFLASSFGTRGRGSHVRAGTWRPASSARQPLPSWLFLQSALTRTQ